MVSLRATIGICVSVALDATLLCACSPEEVTPGLGTGGLPTATGGSTGTGGTSGGASGGTTATGGTATTGGTTGGASTSTGGTTSLGGTATGGSTLTGGTPATTGGSTGTGGTKSATGGSSAAGSVATGGTVGSGGSAGATATGGTPSGGGAGPGSCGTEDCGTACTVPSLPAFSALTANEKLPDPFKMLSGARISSKSQWQCRRSEISAQIQNYEAGKKNPKPPGAVTGSFSGSTLTINVGGKSFTVSVTLPSGNGPFPAIIGLDGISLPGSFTGVAKITFDTNKMGNQSGSRGTGFFYDVTGDNSVGALMAWAWGVSRVIDALEVTPAAKIDPKRIAITGCSRNGKGALMVGAFDERIALTIPQESGSGGVALWRTSYAEDASFGGTAGSHKVQTMDSAYSEQPWFGTALQQFTSATNANKLPFDHHELLAMVAPRGLLILDNTDYQWLGVNSVATGAAAVQPVYQALGVPDNVGFANSGHSHCSPNSAEGAYVNAFVQKFLLGQNTSTKVWNVSKQAYGSSTATVDKAKWIDWTTPTLD